MKTHKEKLIDILSIPIHPRIGADYTEVVADYLLDNDVLPVVRCKDCKHKGWIQEPCHGKSVDFCHVFDSTINNPEKCFCYYGERKRNETD